MSFISEVLVKVVTGPPAEGQHQTGFRFLMLDSQNWAIKGFHLKNNKSWDRLDLETAQVGETEPKHKPCS